MSSNHEDQEKQQDRQRNTRRQLAGIFLGVGLGLMVSALVPAVRQNVELSTVVLWSGALGGVLASLEYFERAGAALTKKDDPVLNYAVGLGLPLLVLVAISLLI